MKLKNTTDWPDWFLRRMVSWCCRELDLPALQVKRAQFGNRSRGCRNGRAFWSMRIRCMIGPASSFPRGAFIYPGRTHERYECPALNDREEALVEVTAHELAHLMMFYRARQRRRAADSSELHSTHHGRRLLELFRANREALIAEWSAAPVERAKPVVSIQDKRAAKAAADLDRWQRKLKLAQTKVRKLKVRVGYYERRQAATRSQ